MPRVLCVWFPKWPIQRLRSARPELSRSELVLFAGQNQRPSITVCSSKAERLGVHAGQPLAEAKALLPKAVFLPADVAADRSALCQLALDCQRFSPLVGLEEGDHPESLLCDVTGCTHLWDGEERFLQAVRGYWRERGYQIQLALAGTIGSGLGARSHHDRLAGPAGDEEAALSGLPVAALRLPPAALERLEALGLCDDWRRAATAARDAGQPVWRDLAAAAGPGARPAARNVCLRAAQGAALGPPRVGSAD